MSLSVFVRTYTVTSFSSLFSVKAHCKTHNFTWICKISSFLIDVLGTPNRPTVLTRPLYKHTHTHTQAQCVWAWGPLSSRSLRDQSVLLCSRESEVLSLVCRENTARCFFFYSELKESALPSHQLSKKPLLSSNRLETKETGKAGRAKAGIKKKRGRGEPARNLQLLQEELDKPHTRLSPSSPPSLPQPPLHLLFCLAFLSLPCLCVLCSSNKVPITPLHAGA